MRDIQQYGSARRRARYAKTRNFPIRSRGTAAGRSTRFAKLQPTASDVHVDRALTDISIDFAQTDDVWIADKVFPVVPVNFQSNMFTTYSRADFNRSEARRRAPATESAGSGYGLTRDLYFCDVFAVHKDIADEERSNSDAELRPDEDATRFLMSQCMILRDVTWAESYFITGVWAGENTPGTLWDAVGSTPIADIRAEIINRQAATGRKPNVLVLSPRVWAVLQDHPDFVTRINAGQTSGIATVSRAHLAAVLELEEVLVAEAVQNSAAEGLAEASDFIVGDNALLVHRARNPGLAVPSAGYTFAWTGLLGASAFASRMMRFRMAHLKADRVECELAFDTRIVANELGHLFLAPIS